jgi:phosphoserine phosphatase
MTQRNVRQTTRTYLLASDFDQTLSFDDSGYALSELLGISGFADKVSKLSELNLVQQGGELAYLLLHDPDFRAVRREHLVDVGKRVQLKQNIRLLFRLLQSGIEDHHFSFAVISAAPQEVVQSALEGIIPADQIFGTRFNYDPDSGQIASLVHVPAGFGKVATLMRLQAERGIADDRVIYMGDGTSDIHVLLHVAQRDGFTVAVSEAKNIAQIAKRTVISENALSVLVPILEDLCKWDVPRIRAFFEQHDVTIHEWAKVRTDWLTLRPGAPRDSRPSYVGNGAERSTPSDGSRRGCSHCRTSQLTGKSYFCCSLSPHCFGSDTACSFARRPSLLQTLWWRERLS